MFEEARTLVYGHGLAKDEARASRLLRDAAAAGYKPAEAFLYSRGIGVSRMGSGRCAS